MGAETIAVVLDQAGYSDNFKYAVEKTLAAEGGAMITDSKYDPGGLTKYGISQRAYPDLNIELLTERDAIDIYYRDYWLKVKADQIKSKYVAAEVFDTAVNMGVRRAGRIAQTAINILHGYPEAVKVDGIIGPITVDALNRFLPKYELPLVVALNLAQGAAYLSILHTNPVSFRAHIKGWCKRLVPAVELLREQ